MKAIRVIKTGPAPELRLEEVPKPVTPQTGVLIRVRYAGINPVDWKTMESSSFGITAPYIPGWDCAGVVEEVGPSCRSFEPGDEVYGLVGFPKSPGTFAEYYPAEADHIAPKPKSLDFREAAGVPLTALTAYQSLFSDLRIEKGQTILLHGASGGVGNFAVQLAKYTGCRVYGTASPGHFEELESIGLDTPIDRTAPGFPDTIPRNTFDFILDSRGDEVRDRAYEYLTPGGSIITLRGGDIPEKEYAEAGIRYRRILVRPDGATLAQIGELFERGILKVSVKEVFPLAETETALELSKSGRINGKIVLDCR